MRKTLNTIKILALALIVSVGLQYVLAAWNGPISAPPENNASAPINVSSTSQVKSGALWGDGGLYSGSGGYFSGNGVYSSQYCDANGNNCFTAGKTIIENRTSDPSSPNTGRIWLRTDL